MRIEWLQKDDRAELLIIVGGWAVGKEAYEHLSDGRYDVLLLHSYYKKVPVLEIKKLTLCYERVDLVAFSFGVKIAAAFMGELSELFTLKIAVNGTVMPNSEKNGIGGDNIEKLIYELDEERLKKFYFSILLSKSWFSRFVKKQKKKTIDSLKDELLFLLEIKDNNREKTEDFFTHAIIGEKDMIFPDSRQRNSWAGSNIKIKEIKAPHFVFYGFSSWHEFVSFVVE